MEHVAAVLMRIMERASAQAVLLTTGDGLMVDSVAEEGVELDALAAYAASYASSSMRLGEENKYGPVDSVVVIYQGKAVVVAPVDASVVVALVGSGGAHLGNMHLQLRRGIEALNQALQAEAHGTVDHAAATGTGSPRPEVATAQSTNGQTPSIPEITRARRS